MSPSGGPGLALAATRLGLGPATLVTPEPDHIVLRTPSQPDFRDGNALHLPAEPDDLGPWVHRFKDTVGQLPGVAHLRLAWPAADPDGRAPRGVVDHDLSLDALRLMRLSGLVAPEAFADIDIVAASDHRHWHAVMVLSRYAIDMGEEFLAFRRDALRSIVASGHGQMWLAYHRGVPVGRGALLHDGHGLAVVDDVVTHPVYRRGGVATSLVHHAVETHLGSHGDDTVVLLAEPDGAAERIYRRLGFEADGVMVQATRLAP